MINKKRKTRKWHRITKSLLFSLKSISLSIVSPIKSLLKKQKSINQRKGSQKMLLKMILLFQLKESRPNKLEFRMDKAIKFLKIDQAFLSINSRSEPLPSFDSLTKMCP